MVIPYKFQSLTSKSFDNFQNKNRIEIMEGVIECLVNLDAQNICHGNLNPSNISVHEENHRISYKLRNYGLYQIRRTADMTYEECTFLPPEIILSQEISSKTDLWSFGCLIYYLATGRRLFHAENIRSLVNKIVKVDYTIACYECNDNEKNLIKKLVKKEKELDVREVKNMIEKMKEEIFEPDSDDITIEYLRQMAAHNVVIPDKERLAVVGQTSGLLESVISEYNTLDNSDPKKTWFLALLLNLAFLPIYYETIKDNIKTEENNNHQFLFRSLTHQDKRSSDDDTDKMCIIMSKMTINCKEKGVGLPLLKEFCRVLPALTKLQELEVTSNDIKDPLMKYVATNLEWKNMEFLREINMKGDELGYDAMKLFSDSLSYGNGPENLRILYLEMNEIGDKGISYLVSRLGNVPKLMELLIGNNNLSDESVRVISKNLCKMPHLQRITLGSNKRITDDGIIYLLKHLHYCPYITTLFFNGMKLTDAIVDPMCTYLQSEVNKYIQYLIMNNNDLSDAGATKLVETIGKTRKDSCCSRLAIFDLNSNSGITNKEKITATFGTEKPWYQFTV